MAAAQAHAKLEACTYDPFPPGAEQAEIDVQYCGICHSGLSNIWPQARRGIVLKNDL
jgi:D-arabinose 1-dehydrogenase-like Zn-dependent alcohol dehydrogenase